MLPIVACHDNDLLDWVLSEIARLPIDLVDFLHSTGLQYGLYKNKITDADIASLGKTPDGREVVECSCYWNFTNKIYFTDGYLEHALKDPKDKFSTPLHEFAHAIDYALGKNTYWSVEHPKMLGTPLDKYAAMNPREQFAQAFEAYFQPDMKSTDNIKSGIVGAQYYHTISEVFEKETRLFWFFKNNLLK